MVLAVPEDVISNRLGKSLIEDYEVKLDDASKIIGCYKALAKVGFGLDEENKNQFSDDSKPMKSALAFCDRIQNSKLLSDKFVEIVNDYEKEEDPKSEFKTNLEVSVDHIDGSYNSDQRNRKLKWLKESIDSEDSRILSNVRCLTEGVDVPSLDAIMFMHPRKAKLM